MGRRALIGLALGTAGFAAWRRMREPSNAPPPLAPEPRDDDPRRPGAGPNGRTATRDELYARARALDIPGRSRMTKRELEQALSRAS